MRTKSNLRLCVLFFSILLATSQSALRTVVAQTDWPSWMGVNRDNRWNETGILENFPVGGPNVLWRTPIAGGYSGPAVAKGHVYITDYATKDDVKVDNFNREEFSGMERLWCLDEKTGKEIWKKEYPVKYSISYPAGPRCTPIVDGDRVYTLGAEGDLYCFDANSGDIKWSKQLKVDYSTKAALWGYAAHPLIDGNNLITLAGGEGSHVVALNKMDGQEVWRSETAPEQGYSPPTIITAGGERQLILAKPDAVASVSPDDGKEYWSVPYEATSGSIIMSPMKVGEWLYVAGYSRQSLLLKLKSDSPGAEEVWRNKGREAISPVNVQPFAADDVIYGMDQDGTMCAIKIPSGERLWSTPDPVDKDTQGSGTAFIVRQGERFWLFNEKGELVIAQMTPAGYSEIDRAKVIEPSNLAFGRKVVWSMPAFCNRHAYIRNDNEIICVDLSK